MVDMKYIFQAWDKSGPGLFPSVVSTPPPSSSHNFVSHPLREKQTLELAVESLTRQLDSSHLEVERLKITNGDLQRQRKLLQEQKEDVIKERERTRKELERGWDAPVVRMALWCTRQSCCHHRAGDGWHNDILLMVKGTVWPGWGLSECGASMHSGQSHMLHKAELMHWWCFPVCMMENWHFKGRSPESILNKSPKSCSQSPLGLPVNHANWICIQSSTFDHWPQISFRRKSADL